MSDSEVLSIERDGHVATLWLDRAEARNAMGPAFWADLPLAMAELSDDRTVRAVVVAARGPHFSVGLDLKAMAGMLSGGADGDEAPAGGNGSAEARPTLHGVTGRRGATEASSACSFGHLRGRSARNRSSPPSTGTASAAASTSSRRATSGWRALTPCSRCARPGWPSSPTSGACNGCRRIIGKGHVAELAFTGKDISAARAKEIGLVNDVLPDADAALAAARQLAAEIAANSPLAVQGTKAVLAACEDKSVAEGLDYVATWNAGFLSSDDLVEAMTAFMEKRPPEFKGR